MAGSPRTVIVTAGAGNVGRNIVSRFVAERARVIAVDVNASGLDELRGLHPAVETVEADVATPEGADRAIAAAGSGLTVLCNNAALIETATVEHLDEEIWNRVLAVNLTGPFLMSKRAIPLMVARGGGVIVNTGSAASLRGGLAGPAYTASKHGLVGLTRNIAAEYAGSGVRCNLVCPGSIERPTGSPPGRLEQSAPGVALTMRMPPVAPAKIADLVAYLAGDAASSINGATITIDGGALA